MTPPNFSRVIGLTLVLSFALGGAMVLRSPNPAGTLDEGYTDSLRHLYSTWLFLRYGSDVFRVPLDELAARDGSPRAHTPWGNYAYIYPPGALLVFAPFAVAEYGLELPERGVHQATILFLYALAHLSVLVFVRELAREEGGGVLVPSVLYTLVALQFSLDGIYDPVYVIPIVLGLSATRRGRRARGLMWLGVASLFHFRAAFFLPVALFLAGGLLRERAWRRWGKREAVEVTVGAVSAFLSAWVLELTRQGFGLREHSALMDPAFGYGGVVVTGAVTVIVVIALARAGDRLSGLTLGWIGALTLALPFTRAWHSLGLYPLFVLGRKTRGEQAWLLVWVLLFGGLAFRHFPNVRWLARGLGLLFGGG